MANTIPPSNHLWNGGRRLDRSRRETHAATTQNRQEATTESRSDWSRRLPSVNAELRRYIENAVVPREGRPAGGAPGGGHRSRDDSTSVDVYRLSDQDWETWNTLLDSSPQATPFHRHEFLSVVADHVNATLHPLVGVDGSDPIGLFPVFETRKGGVRAAFSPPPDLKISYLGPALLDAEAGAERQERHRAFGRAAIQWIHDQVNPSYVSVRTSPRYSDPRPFDWNGFDLRPRFTYAVDLDRSADDLFEAFTSDVRQNVRNATDAGCEVSTVGVAGVDRIISQVQARHEEQGVPYHVTSAFVEDLVETLPDDAAFVYACERDGEFLGGNVVLDTAGAVYGWQGVAKPDHDYPVNDLLHWTIMQDAIERGTTEYDMVGANDQRLSRYKAKFAPSIRQYHTAEHSTLPTKVAAEVYKRLR